MKICTIVGARPQFIKAAALSRVLRQSHREILIHTGQHYDANMSDIFFEELSIPKPDYNLGIAGGTHGKMTGEMLVAIERVLLHERPDMALVYGDTNSTLAGALAAVKLNIPVCHIEAGVRIRTFENPEEVNRVVSDRVATLLCYCTETERINLAAEGVVDQAFWTGDLMLDALLFYGKSLSPTVASELASLDGKAVSLPPRFYYLTCHRAENTNSDDPLRNIFKALNQLDAPTIYPVHPRNKNRALRLVQQEGFANIMLCEPVGYLTSLFFAKNAVKVVTDSGGVQREAWFYRTPCVNVIPYPAWPVTLEGKWNQLCAPDCDEILKKLAITPDPSVGTEAFGDGHAAEKITNILTDYENGVLSCNS